jgi:hypothetical protein
LTRASDGKSGLEIRRAQAGHEEEASRADGVGMMKVGQGNVARRDRFFLQPASGLHGDDIYLDDARSNLVVAGFDSHEMAVIRGRICSWWASHQTGGQIMKKLTSAQLFAPPKKARKIKTKLERAKLVIAAARERAARRAARMAQQHAVQLSMMRPPTVLQRQRLAERLSAKS